MPLAGNKPGDRAIAHIRTAQRYAKPGKSDYMRKAVAHVSRALDYSAIKQQHFGANDDDEAMGQVEAYVERSWVRATSDQKAAFNKAMDEISRDGAVVSGMPRLAPRENKPGAVYHDRKEPLILWYVGRTGHMTPLRRLSPQPTSAWVFTQADYDKAMKERYPDGVT